MKKIMNPRAEYRMIYNFLCRLVGTIFKLLAKEKLGYEVSLVGGEADPSVYNSDLDASFRKLSICKNEL